MTLQSSEQLVAYFLNGKPQMQSVYLPLPDMDQRDNRFHLYKESTMLDIDPTEYSNHFDYVRSGKNVIRNSTIAFVSLLSSSALVFLISATVFFCKFRGKAQEAAVYHQVAETQY